MTICIAPSSLFPFSAFDARVDDIGTLRTTSEQVQL